MFSLLKIRTERGLFLTGIGDMALLTTCNNFRTQQWRMEREKLNLVNSKTDLFLTAQEGSVSCLKPNTSLWQIWKLLMLVEGSPEQGFFIHCIKNDNFLNYQGETLITTKDPRKWFVVPEFTREACCNFPLPKYKPILIGIDGTRRSGKTSLSIVLRSFVSLPILDIISLDKYEISIGTNPESIFYENLT